MNNRMERVNSEVHKALIQIVRDMNNAFLSAQIFHVSFVEVAADLRNATVGVSASRCTSEEKKRIVKELTGAKGYIKRELCTYVNMRNIPDLFFVIDNTEESAQKIENLLKTIVIPPKEEADGTTED